MNKQQITYALIALALILFVCFGGLNVVWNIVLFLGIVGLIAVGVIVLFRYVLPKIKNWRLP